MKTINIAYARLASDNPMAVLDQLSAVCKFMEADGVDISTSKLLVEKSYKYSRPRYSQLIELIQSIPADTDIILYVYSLDRLSRNQDTIKYFLSIKNLIIRVVTEPSVIYKNNSIYILNNRVGN